MECTFEAIYEGGVLKPLESLKLPEHQGVTITIHQPPMENPNQELESWHQVYSGLSYQDIVEIESIVLDRSHFFGS